MIFESPEANHAEALAHWSRRWLYALRIGVQRGWLDSSS